MPSVSIMRVLIASIFSVALALAYSVFSGQVPGQSRHNGRELPSTVDASESLNGLTRRTVERTLVVFGSTKLLP